MVASTGEPSGPRVRLRSLVIFRCQDTDEFCRQLLSEFHEVVVVDPSRFGPDGSRFREVIWNLADALQRKRITRVAVFTHNNADALRNVHAIATTMSCELFIEGIDSAAEIQRELRSSSRDATVRREGKGVTELVVGRLPDALRRVVLTALSEPECWPVKRIASEAGVTRRTLERRFKSVGLPAPGEVIREARIRASKSPRAI